MSLKRTPQKGKEATGQGERKGRRKEGRPGLGAERDRPRGAAQQSFLDFCHKVQMSPQEAPLDLWSGRGTTLPPTSLPQFCHSVSFLDLQDLELPRCHQGRKMKKAA